MRNAFKMLCIFDIEYSGNLTIHQYIDLLYPIKCNKIANEFAEIYWKDETKLLSRGHWKNARMKSAT